MKIRTGVDIVHIPRFKSFLDNPSAVSKVFSSGELARDTPEHLAGVFALKEAFFKALGTNPDFLSIEVPSRRGKPSVTFPDSFGIESVDVSVSHDNDYAIAQVVMILSDDE